MSSISGGGIHPLSISKREGRSSTRQRVHSNQVRESDPSYFWQVGRVRDQQVTHNGRISLRHSDVTAS